MPTEQIGARLGVIDGETSRPFLNAFKQAWAWESDQGGMQWPALVSGGHMTAGGQLIRVPTNSGGYRTRVFHGMPAQAGGSGTWRLRWEGIATWELHGASNLRRTGPNEILFDFTANGGSWVTPIVRSIDPAGGQVRNISLVHRDDWADFDAGKIYRRQFLEECAQYTTLRFDEWIGILRSENQGGLRITSWASRALPTDEIFYRFVPYEWMAALCNEVVADLWVCLPTAATDDHFRKAASLIRSRLRSPLKVHAEYSTKTWDFSGTPQAHYCSERGRAAFNTTDGAAFRNWYGMRAAQMAMIWREVWGADARLETVVQHQADWVDGENDILVAPLWRDRSGQNGLPVYVAPHSVIDVLTVHAQVDGGMAYGGRTAQIDTWRTTLSQTEAFNRMRDQMLRGQFWGADRTISALIPKWRHYRREATKYGMKLSSYEVGNHLNGVGGSAETRAFIQAFSVSPQMGEVYAATFAALLAEGFDGPLAMSVDCRYPDQNVCHGLQRWLGDHNPAWTAVAALIEDEPVVVPPPVVVPDPEPEPQPEPEPEPQPEPEPEPQPEPEQPDMADRAKLTELLSYLRSSVASMLVQIEELQTYLDTPVVTPDPEPEPVDPEEDEIFISDPVFTSYTAATAATRDPSGYRETPEVGSIVNGNLRLTCLEDMLWPRANFQLTNLKVGTEYTANVVHAGGNQYGYWVKVLNGEADSSDNIYYMPDLYEDHSFVFTATQDTHWLQLMSGAGTINRFRDFAGITVTATGDLVVEPVDPEPEPEPTPVDPTPVDPTPVPPVAREPIWDELTRSTISIPASVDVPAGQRKIYIPVTVDHTDRENFYCYVSGFGNISGGNINVGNTTTQRAMFQNWENRLYRWSPGDDLVHYIEIDMRDVAIAGRFMGVNIRVKNLGDSQKGRTVRVNFVEGAQHPTMTPQRHRPLRRLDLSQAVRKNAFDPANMPHHDSGFKDGRSVWRSRLSHGYAQDGNQESGLYMNDDLLPDGTKRFPRAQNPISYDAAEGAVRLHTLAFPMDARPEFYERLWRHQAVMINGQTMDEVCGFEGVWRMVAKTSRRRYAWPAFWLVGRGETGARGSWTQWPPEIDIMEQFNQVWGSDSPITGFTTTFAQHYGNAGTNERVGVFGGEVEVNQWMGATGLAEDYHSYACAIVWNGQDAELTFFFDDVEIGCHVLHARHQDMITKLVLYPMANVAVKAPSTYTPEQYNTDEGRGNSGDMLIRDMGYYPSGFEMRSI